MPEPISDLEQAGPDGVEQKQKVGGSRMLRTLLFVLGGAVLGFAYYRFVGCRTGACPITSSPYISTIYGALIGLLAAH
jgi:hypothetical protein